jgi:hypothetical protein
VVSKTVTHDERAGLDRSAAELLRQSLALIRRPYQGNATAPIAAAACRRSSGLR